MRPKYSRRRRQVNRNARKEELIYFDNGVVTETLPGTLFKVRVERKSKNESVKDDVENSEKELPPIVIICALKTKLIKRRVLIIKGDTVVVEVSPEDMYFDDENTILKGQIIERK